MKHIKPNFRFDDERGFLIEIIKGDAWKQLSHSSTRKGTTRGGHYHKITKEFFYVIKGSAEVKIKNAKTGKEETFIAKKGDCFVVEPYDIHWLTAIEDAEWVVLLSKEYDENDKDIYK